MSVDLITTAIASLIEEVNGVEDEKAALGEYCDRQARSDATAIINQIIIFLFGFPDWSTT